METKKINVTFEVEDNDLVIFQFEKRLREVFGNSVGLFQILPNTSNMYDKDVNFRKLCKIAKDARIEKEKYINEFNYRYK